MSGTLIIITGVIYLCVSVEQFALGHNGMGVTYLGYSFANWGLWMMAK
jgi:hypothetical protein